MAGKISSKKTIPQINRNRLFILVAVLLGAPLWAQMPTLHFKNLHAYDWLTQTSTDEAEIQKIDIPEQLEDTYIFKSHILGTDFGNNPNLPTVAVVTTGGTIAQKPDPVTGASVPSVSGSEMIAGNPELLKIANIRLVEFSNIDSSQMSPAKWLELSTIINRLVLDPKIDGVVVTHGTDTMVEGAFFLDLTVAGKKPIVFTGAMKDASAPGFDGTTNLHDAVVQACSPKAYDWGVTVNLNRYIHSARDVAKTHTTNMQTFYSGIKGCLGYMEKENVLRFHDRNDRLYIKPPEKLAHVVLIRIYAGDDGKLVRTAADSGAKGIVIEGFGAGNVNTNVAEAIDYVISKNIPVVITSQVPEGGVYPIYGDDGGGATLQKRGAILGGSLPGNKARILLMLLLSSGELDHKTIESYFNN